MEEPSRERAAEVKALAASLGYVACGITSAEPFQRFAEVLRNRMVSHPSAAHFYEHMLKRSDPRVTTPWAESIIVCVRRYGKYKLPAQAVGHIARNYLADRRREPCADYLMPKRMTAGLKDLGLRVKRGGVPDRWAAARAGAARIGKNCSAYAEGAGSWINIECWRADAPLWVDTPTLESPCPEGCRACMDACPTQAIEKPLVLCHERCVAYLSYEAPRPIDPELAARMGPWIYGCDRCQEVCPLNKGRWEDLEPTAWLDDIVDLLTPEALAGMDEATYREKIHPLFWYIPADQLDRWHENARRAVAFQNRLHHA